MNTHKIDDITSKAIEIPMEMTRGVLEKSKKLRHPSQKVNRIGSSVGMCAGAGLLITGAVQLLTGRALWAVGTLSAGAVAIASNLITYSRRKKE